MKKKRPLILLVHAPHSVHGQLNLRFIDRLLFEQLAKKFGEKYASEFGFASVESDLIQ